MGFGAKSFVQNGVKRMPDPANASKWLHIVGIGEDGMDGLTPATRSVVEAAEVIIGGDRHHQLAPNVTATRVAWPSPFDVLIDKLLKLKGKRVVVLATGDPLWFSVGARIGREIDPSEIVYHPQLSAFQLTAARMGWSIADVETLTVHGRPVHQMVAFIQPDQRLIILTTGAETPGQIAKFLTERGFGQSQMTVLASMGGEKEQRFEGVAESWSHEVPAFNTLAVHCKAAPNAALLPRVPGLSDDLFQSDGTMTKQEVRARHRHRTPPRPPRHGRRERTRFGRPKIAADRRQSSRRIGRARCPRRNLHRWRIERRGL